VLSEGDSRGEACGNGRKGVSCRKRGVDTGGNVCGERNGRNNLGGQVTGVLTCLTKKEGWKNLEDWYWTVAID